MRNISLSKVRGPIWAQANMAVRENPGNELFYTSGPDLVMSEFGILFISLTTMYIYRR